MEGLENMAFIAIAVSLMTYFFGYMNFSLTKSATTLTNFLGTAFLLALVGGFISDTYISRFKACVLFACTELLVSLSPFPFVVSFTWASIQFPIHYEKQNQLSPTPISPSDFRNEAMSYAKEIINKWSILKWICVTYLFLRPSMGSQLNLSNSITNNQESGDGNGSKSC